MQKVTLCVTYNFKIIGLEFRPINSKTIYYLMRYFVLLKLMLIGQFDWPANEKNWAMRTVTT